MKSICNPLKGYRALYLANGRKKLLTLQAADVKEKLPFHKEIWPSIELSPEEELTVCALFFTAIYCSSGKKEGTVLIESFPESQFLSCGKEKCLEPPSYTEISLRM